MKTKTIKIFVRDDEIVSGIWLSPPKARACLILAHGAGAGMTHPTMNAIAEGLAERGIATLRFQFPYMEKASKRPDPPKVAIATVRAAVEAARKLAGKTPLFAGGKSYGGRMTSHAQSEEALLHVRGLIFFGFPLHAAGAPSINRADHLDRVKIPMLFLQGSRDALAQLTELKRVTKRLGARAMLKVAEDADHSFRVPAESGRKNSDVLALVLDDACEWMVIQD